MITKFKIYEKSEEIVVDYKGEEIPLEDAVWCEYDREYYLKKDAIWVDYNQFWTTPEIPKEDNDEPIEDKIKWWKNGKLEEAIKWYKKGKLTLDPDSDINVPEYNDFITDDQFRNFLIENDGYEDFIKYCKRPHKDDFEYRFRSGKYGFIDNSLNWSGTKKGSEFWCGMNSKWNSIVRSMNEGIKWYNKGKLILDPDSDINVPEEDDFITDYEFRNFLINNGVYDEFISMTKGKRSKSSFDESFKRDRKGIINNAFTWSFSPSGERFWSDLDEEWYEMNVDTNEGIKWYSKGKFEPSNEPFEEYDETEFKVGDEVFFDVGTEFWYDVKASGGKREMTSLKNDGKWEKGTRQITGIIDNIDYCEDVKGYTGQIIQLEFPYWPWYQTTGCRKI